MNRAGVPGRHARFLLLGARGGRLQLLWYGAGRLFPFGK